MALEEVELTHREKDGRLQARLTYTITVEEGTCVPSRVYTHWC